MKEKPPVRANFKTDHDYNLAYLGFLCLIEPDLKNTYIYNCVIKQLAKDEDADKNKPT